MTIVCGSSLGTLLQVLRCAACAVYCVFSVAFKRATSYLAELRRGLVEHSGGSCSTCATVASVLLRTSSEQCFVQLWIWLLETVWCSVDLVAKNRGFSVGKVHLMIVCQFFRKVTSSLSTRHVCDARGVFMGIPTRDILPPLVQHVRIQSCAVDWQG